MKKTLLILLIILGISIAIMTSQTDPIKTHPQSAESLAGQSHDHAAMQGGFMKTAAIISRN